MDLAIPRVDGHSPPEAKVALFRRLFRGRDDVFARRFENRRTGKSGYAPVCAHEWMPGICEKPRIKCAACSHQRFVPVTDDAVRWHLLGTDDAGREFVMGVYPMLRDETCHFLAVDLDNQTWRDDSRAILQTCRELGLPAVWERSRSGNGAHLWLFFATPLPATLARKLGATLLTETMDRQPEIGLDSYDRLFPNQDTLPQGGFGNLIALPLQKGARTQGNSVFLDDQGEPYADQWSLLSSIEPLERQSVEAIVSRAAKRGRVVGVRFPTMEDDPVAAAFGPTDALSATNPSLFDASEREATPTRRLPATPLPGPLPERLELILGNQIYIAKEELTPALWNRLIRIAAFQNPEFYRAQAMRLPTYGKPRIISCAEVHPAHLALPRGCLDEVQALLKEWRITSVLRDERHGGEPLPVAFHGELLPDQEAAAKSLLAHDTGVLAATTAFGKTVIAAWLIGERKVNTLVLVHRRQLMDQWVERLATFLDVPAKSIGRLGGGRRGLTKQLDVALIQSLTRKGEVLDLVGDYGQLIVDECHHLSAVSFEQVVRQAKARYVTGLSATVTRKDGHHPIISMQCGPIRHRVDPRSQAALRPFSHAVLVRPTGFRSLAVAGDDKRVQFQQLYDELMRDPQRNRLICEEVQQAVAAGRSPLVLTERNEHLDVLAAALEGRVGHLVILRGGMRKKEVAAAAARLVEIPEGESRVLIATGRYVGEGFDDARLDTLFLTLPVSWHGTVAQYVGRLHRRHQAKREVIVYDYADLDVPMLSRMFDRRCRGYEAVGYVIQLPASAVPGWPPEVPLPIDPRWKTTYAASVQRLIRDGVDVPLAGLFQQAAQDPALAGEGVGRARSATEAFLYRRLETLEATRGRFRLNTHLPIPFDGHGGMEIDLLCAGARLAIELDGAQHLDGGEPYRRDRRKDALLQEHGHFVLRFLAADVSQRLDAVLDAILRALDHLGRIHPHGLS
ncbi:MAG: TOTE conflict system archaeo-eukaryotic primase domain-containing protein [Planctomycetales bacterium]